ncbi:hypothetical protein C3L33_13974, partial [Rhododendron williamsianum]
MCLLRRGAPLCPAPLKSYNLHICLRTTRQGDGYFLPRNSNRKPIGEFRDFRRVVAEFSMETPGNRKGVQLVENAKNRMAKSNSCWQNAYQNLFAGCSEILAGEEKRSRLLGISVIASRKTPEAGFSLLTDAFKRQTERLVNELKKSAQFAEDKLDIIEEKAEELLQSSSHIHDSLASIDVQTQQVSKMTKNVEDHVNVVLKHAEAVYEQSKEIAGSQSELQESQAQMKNKLEESMEKKIGEVGDAMASKMNTLQSKADDIGNIAGISLDKQKQLLDGQSVALDGLEFLTKFQSQALEQTRGTLQQLSELGNKQQDQLLQRQELLQQTHDRLAENSKTILEAQCSRNSDYRSFSFLGISATCLIEVAILRDLELANHHMILEMYKNHTDLVKGKRLNTECSWESDCDSDVNWSSFVDTEIKEDIDSLGDPDYMLPEEVVENSVATSLTPTKTYNLRCADTNHADTFFPRALDI